MSLTPDNWVETTFCDVTSYISRGKSPKYAEFSKLPIVNQRAIRWHGIQKEYLKYIHPDQIDQWTSERFIQEGDVLWNSTGTGTIGRACLVQKAHLSPPKVVDSHVTIIRPNKEVIDPRYLFAWIRSPEIQKAIVDLSSGSTNQIELNRSTIAEIHLPLAPINEQKRIADKLDVLLARVDACRERLDLVPQILKRFRQAVFTAATTGALTEELAGAGSWTTSQLGTLLTDVRYGTAKKSTYDIKDGTPVLRIPNIINGRVDTNDLKYGHFEKKELETLSLKEGDLLIIRSNGSLDLVGKTAVVGSEVQGYLFAGYLIRLRVKSNLIDPRFLYFCLSSPDTRQHIELTARSTSGVNNINSEEIRSIEIKLPGVGEQHEIIRRVEILFAFADRLEARYNAGRELVDQLIPSLLDKAFSGELTAEWREQNPDLISGENSADALIAQITIQKIEADRANINNRKSVKTKTGKNMKPKMIIPVAVALKAAGTPLAAQALLTQSGYSSDATTEDLERFFLDIREQLKLGSILRERSGDNDIFTLVN